MHDEDLEAWGDDAEWDLLDGGRPAPHGPRHWWLRATAGLLAATLAAGSIGTAVWLLSGALSRPDCSGSAANAADIVGRRIADAEEELSRSENRCGRAVVRLQVASTVRCERDAPGTIAQRGALTYDLDGDPVVPVSVCASAV